MTTGQGRVNGMSTAEDVLRAAGHRLTPQRLLVWETLRQRTGEHLPAESIHTEVCRTLPTLNLASVYRTLTLLVELGLARETRVGDGPALWEVAHGAEHHHLVCRICGRIDHHEDPTLITVVDHLRTTHGFAAEDVDLVVTGVCARCTSGQQPAPAGH